MDAYKLVQEDIQKFIRTWLKTGMICNPQVGGQFFGNKNLIQSKYSFYNTEQEYISNFIKDYEQNAFFVALFDGSFFQLNYEFETVKRDVFLKKANICYIPCVVDGEYIHEYLRLDYDTTVTNSFFHPIAHLHVGFKDGMRIPVDEIPLFTEFFKLVMYLYYQEKYLELVKCKTISNTYMNEQGKLSRKIPISNELIDFVYLKISILKSK